jgi:Ca-activated chloride channel family protein
MDKGISLKILATTVLFVLAFWGSFLPAHAAQDTAEAESPAKAGGSPGNLIFILDASGSMWGQIEGTAKIAIAKEVLTGLIEDLPEDVNVGLVAYGHRSKGDCKDVEELVSLSPVDKEKLVAEIQGINPKGKTPITLSVQMTADKIKVLEDETTIILVSDGKETCEGDPCALVEELKKLGIRFVMHVIGFDVTEEERAQLECMAEAGGGEYLTAKTAGEFKMAAEKVVEQTQNVGTLKTTTIKNGKPFDAKVFYCRGGEEQSFFNESTHSHSGEAIRKLPPGIYDIRVVDYHTAGNPAVTIEGIEIQPGKTAERTANFSNGILKMTTYVNGEPDGLPVDIFDTDGKKLLNTWTQQGSRTIELLQGVYDAKVTKVDIPGGNPVVWFRGVEIKPDQTVEKRADFHIGFLKVSATLNGEPFNTRVKLYKSGSTADIGHWTSDNGSRTFPLVPGPYDVNVVHFEDNKQCKELKGVRVEAAKTETIDVAFPIETAQAQEVSSTDKTPTSAPETAAARQPRAETSPARDTAEAAGAAEGSKSEEETTEQQEEIFGGAVPLYTGAQVTKTATMGSVTQVELLTEASPEEVVNFYKKEMTGKGWNVMASVVQGNTATAAFQKGSSQLVIGAQKRDAGTVVSLTMR